MNFIKTGIYTLALLWTLLITALIGNVIAEAPFGTPPQINFCMFVAVFSWIALLIGHAGSFTEAIPAIALLVIDLLAVFFTFIAAVVLSAKLGVHSCNNFDYITTNDTITGSPDLTKRCHELQASCAFFWFLFATFGAALATNALNARGGGFSSRGGVHKGFGV